MKKLSNNDGRGWWGGVGGAVLLICRLGRGEVASSQATRIPGLLGEGIIRGTASNEGEYESLFQGESPILRYVKLHHG